MSQTLFVEGLKLRPSQVKVLDAIAALGGEPAMIQQGVSVASIAELAKLTQHTIRARLHELRRLGLIESGLCPDLVRRGEPQAYGHFLTSAGLRRLRQR
ncbi:MAG: hypothetical protein AAF711_01155 [Planctomycetota bacterium]